eukprot:TRINITY_DN1723_c0_g1_i1.p1 TRINITY_DN1723_c0_g1~~TRINITY_DN1723_c0_g1_i1.p1  ORF type:complete len:775 (+),score=49.80 TRINITY_DN1723_c0_g1_i1:5746-8070(+)
MHEHKCKYNGHSYFNFKNQMFDSRVFECGVCLKRYNLGTFHQVLSGAIEKNRPLSLPCGHVFCEECLLKCSFESDKPDCHDPSMARYIVCPSDNKRHYGVNLSSLPCCYTILSNLPKDSSPSIIMKEMCCIRHPKKKIKFFCETHNEFLCSTCIVQHTGPGHTVTNFSITCITSTPTFIIDDQAKQNLEDILYKYDFQLSEATKQKSVCETSDKKLFEYFTCQLNKLNMAYDSAIKIINEKRKQFTEILKQSVTDEKRRLDAEKSKLYKKIDKLNEAMKPLKDYTNKLDHIPYEELYKVLLQKNSEFKQISDGPVKSIPEVVYACFKDTVKLSDLGSIQYLKGSEVKDFPISKVKSGNSPSKDGLDRREKCNSIQKGHSRLSDLDTSKTHRRERKANRIDKTCVDAIAAQNELSKVGIRKEDGQQQKINESLYPQTSRGKNNYFAISAYQPPSRSKATPSKHKNPKLTTNSSHTSTKAPDSLTPKPAKEASETMIKYGTSNLTGISRLAKKEFEKENLVKDSEPRNGKVQTTREIPGDKVIMAGTSRGSSLNPNAVLINPVIEEPFNENEKSMVKVLDYEQGKPPVGNPKEFNIFEANILNSEYVNALNNTSVVAHRVESGASSKTSQRSTSTSHRQTHMAKYAAGGTKNAKSILQPKQIQQQVIKIQSRDKALSNHPPQVPKKKHVWFSFNNINRASTKRPLHFNEGYLHIRYITYYRAVINPFLYNTITYKIQSQNNANTTQNGHQTFLIHLIGRDICESGLFILRHTSQNF